MMEPESTESVIRRMCRALGWADGFALYFALVNLPSARRAIALQVIEQLERPVIQIDVPAEGFGDTTLDGWLLPKLEEMEGVTAESAIFLHGLDFVMPTGKVAMCHFFQLLNWRRSALSRIDRPLVIWLPQHALDSMAEHAPDLYDWYSNVYEFASPKEEAEELRGSFITEFNTEVHPALRQSKAEKEQWLHTLTSLLDEHPQRNTYRARLLNEAGMIYYASGNLVDALDLYQQSLAICQELGNKKSEGTILNNISQIYNVRGDYIKALKYLKQSLTIHQYVGNKAMEGTTLNNISQIYLSRDDYNKALSYLKQSLAIHRKIDDKNGEGTTLSNIGLTYKAQGNSDKALPLYERSLAIFREIGDRSGEGSILNNIGQIYKAQGDYVTALTYLEQSLVIRQEIGDQAGEAVTNWNIGWTYKDQGNLAKAEQYMARTVEIDEDIGHPDLESDRKALEEVRAAIKER